jgi:N-acetylated-alpha-linked acidic dipeptidase
VLYVNSDTNGRGILFMDGSHSYQHFGNEVARGVLDPETGASILERRRAKIKVDALEKTNAPDKAMTPDDQVLLAAANAGGDLPLGALGSGSDYTPFIQHLGIAAINLGYGGEDAEGGIYHSTYDSFDHFIRFGDPKFEYCVALAQTAGRLTLRASNADVLPMRLGDLADTVSRYVAEVEKLTTAEREDSKRMNALIDEGAFRLAADPAVASVPPQSPDSVPSIDYSLLEKASARLKQSATAYDGAFARASASDFSLSAGELAQVNAILQGIEQTLTSKRGLPGRDWYQHMLYAPGMLTGYGAKTLPAVREAIEQRRWPDAIAYIPVVASSLNLASARLDQATAILTGRPGVPAPGPASRTPPPPDS